MTAIALSMRDKIVIRKLDLGIIQRNYFQTKGDIQGRYTISNEVVAEWFGTEPFSDKERVK